MPERAAPAGNRPRLPASVAGSRIARFLPSRRSFLVGAGVIAIAAGGYAIARETALFAIKQVDVIGGSKAVDAQVARALSPLVGRSLVGLNGPEVLQRADELPTVVSATYDRAFPNTLRVTIVPERPVAVLRAGAAAWVISARGRVMQSIATDGAHALPRIWKAQKSVRVGEMLPLSLGGALAHALDAARAFRARLANAALVNGQLIFHLRSGLALVLGSPSAIALKLAVTAKVLPQLPSGTVQLDVSVPSRPVSSAVLTSS